ncbi:MAG: hypothetical protein ACRDGS_00945, partial [Chloroflexota bacterium]
RQPGTVGDALMIRGFVDLCTVAYVVIDARYMGAEAAEAFGKRNAVDGEMLVRVTPTKVIAVAALAE